MKNVDVESEDYPWLLAEFFATNPYHATLLGRTIDIANNPENIPGFALWMAGVIRQSLDWIREQDD